MSREVLAVGGAIVGGVIGFFVGAPVQGAQIGFMVGSAVGGVVDPEVIPAPNLGEAPIQTSRDGVPIPIFWGLCHCHGNVIIKNPEVQWTTTESTGKGGGAEVQTNHRSRTFGIGLGRSVLGPIAAVVRIWENDRLVYDRRTTPAIPVAETDAYEENLTIYYGGEDQLPDPELESHWGVGDTPAFRGLAYIVWNNYELTDFGGAIPQYRFEINTAAGFAGTSHVYALEFTDALTNVSTPIKGDGMSVVEDGLSNMAQPQNGLLGAVLETYEMEDEALDNTAAPANGLLGAVLVEYEASDEALSNTATPQNGLLGDVLVTYVIPDDALTNTATPQDGTLT